MDMRHAVEIRAAKKKARERRNANVKAAEFNKKAKERKAKKEVAKMMKAQRKQPMPSWVRRILGRQVMAPKPDWMTKEQVHEEFVKIAEKRSTLSRRDRMRVEYLHEQSIKGMFGLDKKNKIGTPCRCLRNE